MWSLHRSSSLCCLLSSLFIALPSQAESFRNGQISLSEVQYWTFNVEAEQFNFNAPWDENPGDGIQRDAAAVPASSVSCGELAKATVAAVFSQSELAALWNDLFARGVTRQLLIVVNVVDESWSIQRLQRLDRDAYFWHWNRPEQRPSLALSNFRFGQWVWEVLAYPSRCVQPDPSETKRYLQYVQSRTQSLPIRSIDHD